MGQHSAKGEGIWSLAIPNIGGHKFKGKVGRGMILCTETTR